MKRRTLTLLLAVVGSALAVAALVVAGSPTPSTNNDEATASATAVSDLEARPSADEKAAEAQADRAAAEEDARAQAERAAAERAAAEKAAAEEAAAERAAAEQAAAEAARLEAERAAAEQAAADRLAAVYNEADALQDAANAAGWSGPVCSPDARLHSEQAGESLSDDELAAECEGRLGEAKQLIEAAESAAAEGWYTPNGNWVSPETAARALAAGIAPGETVPNYLRCGTICGEGPTSGEVQMAHMCQDGALPPEECAGIDADSIIAAASSYSGW